VDACNPLLQAHPTWARDKHEGRGISTSLTPVSFPPFALRLAPTHLGWGTRRHFTRRPRDPRSRNADTSGGPLEHGRWHDALITAWLRNGSTSAEAPRARAREARLGASLAGPCATAAVRRGQDGEMLGVPAHTGEGGATVHGHDGARRVGRNDAQGKKWSADQMSGLAEKKNSGVFYFSYGRAWARIVGAESGW
jgi:hypothetical protein